MEFGIHLTVNDIGTNKKSSSDNKFLIEELKHGKDITLEVFENDLNKAVNLTFTSSLEKIIDCNVYIIKFQLKSTPIRP